MAAAVNTAQWKSKKIDGYLYELNRTVGANAGGVKPGKVMVDALFKLAGELPLDALNKKQSKSSQKNQ